MHNFTPDYHRNYTFIGTEGRVENSEPDMKVWVKTRRSNSWRELADRTYEVKAAAGGHGGADPVICKDFEDMNVYELVPLIRQFCRSEYGIALGGAHVKGAQDAHSDVDLYLFAREALRAEQRAELCRQFSQEIHTVTGWGEGDEFVQAGTDFYLGEQKVECWLRHSDYISDIITECKQGVVRRDDVTWTVMGFFNHCTLSDLHNMQPLDDPYGVLARWQAEVREYPPRLRETILNTHLRAAKFWPDNFHYITAVERRDVIYVMGIVQQVVHNLIQVIFALNRAYFPGEKKLALAMERLAIMPERFTERITHLIFPGVVGDLAFLRNQRQELGRLVREVEALVTQTGGAQ